jgi:hypothetical protein
LLVSSSDAMLVVEMNSQFGIGCGHPRRRDRIIQATVTVTVTVTVKADSSASKTTMIIRSEGMVFGRGKDGKALDGGEVK